MKRRRFDRDKVRQLGALGYLLLLGGLTLAGPYGFLAWGENLSLLDKRQAQIHDLEKERAELKNRVALLDPRHVDPDMAGELIRSDLNVVHPDEYIYEIHDK
ncbi:MAG TPA: septum formation initiator family protein [Croceibacterium sp.]|nr:septum formation initiator family protein [Croceibacterium sp.]